MYNIEKIPHLVAEKLGYYVYLYIDPRSNKPFYVGKGQRSRVLSHLSANGESRKLRIINELRKLGLEPRLEILSHDLPSEDCALHIEAATIDLLGLDELSNKVRGWKSLTLGRISLKELTTYYAAEPVTINHSSVLIRVNKKYFRGISAQELYEVTRGVWKMGERRESAYYAFAVFEGVVREVYKIDSWHKAGSTEYLIRQNSDINIEGRWEFVGIKAQEEIRQLYFGKSVSDYFVKGQQSPFSYVNC